MIYNYGIGTVEMKGGTVCIDQGVYWYSTNNYGIFNEKEGIVKLINGTIKVTSGKKLYIESGYCNGIGNKGNGKIEIHGGIITCYNNGISNDESGTIEVQGGSINSGQCGILNNGNGSVEISGGEVKFLGENCLYTRENIYGIRNRRKR
ncbi:MAG: hypothetical protein HUJ68_00265 [Clostridia bacterium]|nr:hypothetical protein [Clostridia bacterium]